MKQCFQGFTWWGICPRQDCSERITSTFIRKVYVPDYLMVHSDSCYGNHAFICRFADLLSAYAESRDCSVGRICIRKGGTLRYSPQEICYVLIISSNSDRVKCASPASERFHTNRLIDKSGKIIDATTIPTFSPEYTITWINRKNYSYETLCFSHFISHKQKYL